jgi:hypothetical protein
VSHPLAGLRQVQLVTVATVQGELRSGWLLAGVVDLPDDLVVIDGRLLTVLNIGPTINHPTNGLPQWLQARPLIDRENQCA